MECGFLVIIICVGIFVKKTMQTLILDHFIAVSNHKCIFPYQLIYVKCKLFSVQSRYK